MASPGVLRGLTLVSLPKLLCFLVPKGVLKRWSKTAVRGEGLDCLQWPEVKIKAAHSETFSVPGACAVVIFHLCLCQA